MTSKHLPLIFDNESNEEFNHEFANDKSES